MPEPARSSRLARVSLEESNDLRADQSPILVTEGSGLGKQQLARNEPTTPPAKGFAHQATREVAPYRVTLDPLGHPHG